MDAYDMISHTIPTNIPGEKEILGTAKENESKLSFIFL